VKTDNELMEALRLSADDLAAATSAIRYRLDILTDLAAALHEVQKSASSVKGVDRYGKPYCHLRISTKAKVNAALDRLDYATA
jgi:hypothetical protein